MTASHCSSSPALCFTFIHNQCICPGAGCCNKQFINTSSTPEGVINTRPSTMERGFKCVSFKKESSDSYGGPSLLSKLRKCTLCPGFLTSGASKHQQTSHEEYHSVSPCPITVWEGGGGVVRGGVLDGGGVQQAAKCLEVWWEDRGGGGGGRGEAELHLQPVGGGRPSARCISVLRDKRSTTHVQLVETGAGETGVLVAGRRAPLRWGLELSWGTTTAGAGVPQIVQRQEGEGTAELRTSVSTQVWHQSTVWGRQKLTSGNVASSVPERFD